jgi:hypothetical protein
LNNVSFLACSHNGLSGLAGNNGFPYKELFSTMSPLMTTSQYPVQNFFNSLREAESVRDFPLQPAEIPEAFRRLACQAMAAPSA